ncbi:5,6-dimethylbenzimidazole synthase [Roseibium hamelinense]|uniref:5,6-dimethylbenzimidazole synthase n=1 Tax=Roseibium hamelinense TaxID=150831 RepID=UPI001FCB4815|nr:5,6-dimethylbenzimidazole synthase [Roseibium hamelinense]
MSNSQGTNNRTLQESAPVFTDDFARVFKTLLTWRRDVRRFKTDPIAHGELLNILEQADLAPSVGNSQPWRIVRVRGSDARRTVAETFENENAKAASAYGEKRASLYYTLKLAGLREAPEHLAVFCDPNTHQGDGLGRQTMPETMAYSVVGMVQTLWLAARIKGIGVGWVSILDPAAIHKALNIPDTWQFIGYLCLGYPEEEHIEPELQRAGWQGRTPMSDRLFER